MAEPRMGNQGWNGSAQCDKMGDGGVIQQRGGTQMKRGPEKQ